MKRNYRSANAFGGGSLYQLNVVQNMHRQGRSKEEIRKVVEELRKSDDARKAILLAKLTKEG